MPQLGTCIASTVHILTLVRAAHSIHIAYLSSDSGHLALLSPSCRLPVASLSLFWHFQPPVAPLSLACRFPVAVLSLPCRSPVAPLSLSCRPPVAILSLPVACCRPPVAILSLPVASCRFLFDPEIFTKRFRRTLATFEECPNEGTSFTVHYTVFQGYLQSDKLL